MVVAEGGEGRAVQIVTTPYALMVMKVHNPLLEISECVRMVCLSTSGVEGAVGE